MMTTIPRFFLDTSVIFSAVLSETGGARKLFRLAEAGVIQLIVGPAVLRECDAVVRRKAQTSLAKLAVLLEYTHVQVSTSPEPTHMDLALRLVAYQPDAHVLAEAIAAQPDWFVTHDKLHFLRTDVELDLPFEVGTPGDGLQSLADQWRAME